MFSNLTEVAAHLRKRIKHENIAARVRVAPGGGFVQVNAPQYDYTFPDNDQKTIRHIAKCMGLTSVKGIPIDVDRMTNPSTFSFYLPVSK